MAKLIEDVRQIAGNSGLTVQDRLTQIVARVETADVDATAHSQALKALAAELGEDGESIAEAVAKGDTTAAGAAVVAVVSSMRTRQAGMVPAGDLSQLNGRIAALEGEIQSRDCEALLTAHATKVPPVKREWFQKWFKADRAAATEWLKEAPELVLTRSVNSGAGAVGGNRETTIIACRNQLRAEESAGLKTVGTERGAINGLLIAEGLDGITDAEVAQFGIRTKD